MALETGDYVGDLVVTNPTSGDAKSQGDDHLRLLKTALKNCFSGFSGHILITGTEAQGSTVNDYVVTADPAITEYTDSSIVFFKAAHTNTGAATLKVSALAAKDIKTIAGAALTAGDLVTNAWYAAVYNGTNFRLVSVTQNYIDQLSLTTALPNQSGNEGEFIRTDGTNANWYPLLSGVGSVLTSNATLTAVSETTQRTAPTGYGMSLTMPDATTVYKEACKYIIDNTQGGFPVILRNNSGTLLGFVPAGKVAISICTDNSTADGVWRFIGADRAGCSAELQTVYLDNIYYSVDIGSGREFILGADSATNYSYCVVYNRLTNTFSNVVQVRAAAVGSAQHAILAAADKVLVVSCTSGSTALEGVIVDTSGANPVPGTAATATLSANLSGFAERGSAIVATSAGWVISYRVATPACELRAITVSGSTVTIGNAATLTGTQGTSTSTGGLIVAATGGVVAASTATTHLYTNHYTQTGATLAVGTGTDTNSGTMTLNRFGAWGNYFAILYNDGGSTVKGGVVSLSGTTTSISAATLFSAGTLDDAEFVGSTKLVVLNNQNANNVNILTNATGTASAGTAITQSTDTTRTIMYVDGNNAIVESGAATGRRFDVIDCSGASPVAGRIIAKSQVGTESIGASNNAAFSKLYGNANISSTKYKRRIYVAHSVADGAGVLSAGIVENGGFYRLHDANMHHVVSSSATGSAESNRWLTDTASVIAKVEGVA